MIRSSELAVLGVLEGGDTIADVAEKLDHDASYVSRTVSGLEEKGLVRTERDGRYKRVHPSDARAVELYQDIVRQYSHVDFPALLTGVTLEVLFYFDRPSSVAELAERSDNYRNTVNRVLKRLRDRGIVGTDDGKYRFTDDFDRLHEFARAFAHHRNRRRLESVSPNGTILWETADEFLAQTETEITDSKFLETGPARFVEYGLQLLLTGHRYYFYSDALEELSPAELCCHTLLIDDDIRHRSYCLLLVRAADIDEDALRDCAEEYGLETVIDGLLQYLETEGDAEDEMLPAWTEFTDLAAEYEVSL